MESESTHLKTLENLNSLQISSLREEEDEEIGERIEEEEGEADDDDDDEDEEEEDVAVTLGFVEKPKNPQSLLRHLFPSKAGGVPAWLDPVDLPSEKSRNCGFCGEPLQFLLQVYAPISEKESAFHRTLFIFMCTSMTCLLQDQHEQWKRKPEKPSRSVKVFRCQLPRSNTFYSSNPPKHDGTDKPSGAGAALCCWCGTWKGEKLCSSCRRARYCSEKHQVMHWRSGHKVDCRWISISSQSPSSTDSNSRNTLAEIDKAKALPWQHQIHQCPSQQGWQCTSLTLVCLLCNGSNIQWPEVVYAFGVLLLELLMGKCLSLIDNAGGGTIMDLPSWVQLVVREEWMAEVFDPQMVEMPQIAMVCTLVVSDQQLRMGQVAKMIEEVCGGGGELSP